MESIINSISLFLPQILIGSIIGIFLSALGIILILRNLTFMGITISQIATLGFALTLFFGAKNELLSHLFSVIFFIPFFVFTRTAKNKGDTILGILFVSFGALSQILISFGGNVQNHLLAAYFGDILTSEVKFGSYSLPLLIICFLIFLIYYKRILFLSFDRDEFFVRGFGKFPEFIFFIIITLVVSIAVNLLGSFYSAALLIIPAFTALYLFRSMFACFLFAGLLSVFATFGGFILSLVEIQYKNEIIYLPTSSTIVCLLTLSSLVLVVIRRVL